MQSMKSGGKSWLLSDESGTYIKMLHKRFVTLQLLFRARMCIASENTFCFSQIFNLLLIFHYVASEGTVKEPSMPDMCLAGYKVLEKATI